MHSRPRCSRRFALRLDLRVPTGAREISTSVSEIGMRDARALARADQAYFPAASSALSQSEMTWPSAGDVFASSVSRKTVSTASRP